MDDSDDPVVGFIIEYARSGRAACRGYDSCGQVIDKGTLRLGTKELTNVRGRVVVSTSWKHWECVTTDDLKNVKRIFLLKPVWGVEGLGRLRPADLSAVADSIDTGRLIHPPPPPEDDPETSPSPNRGQGVRATPRKRKVLDEEPYSPPAEVPDVFSHSGEQATEEDEEANEEHEELYIAFPSQVVGIRHYTGLVQAGELVSVVREPSNKYDRNAIQVVNASGVQVGHIPQAACRPLAPLMDEGLVTVEGVMKTGNMSGQHLFTLDITLNIFGPSDPKKRAKLEPRLNWATPGQRGFNQQNQTGIAGTSLSPRKSRPQPATSSLGAVPNGGPSLSASQKAYELARMMSQLAQKDDEDRRATVLDSLCSKDVLNLPVRENPPSRANGYLKNDLLKHQSQGLEWCIDREYPVLPRTVEDDAVQFWKLERRNDNQPYYYNLATRTPRAVDEAPVLGRGAIMADVMGLGKTLTMLALILATLNDKPSDHSNTTLIVAPLSVMSNWIAQIQEHVAKQLRVYQYHGNKRRISAQKLAEYDIVITTYEMVTSDWNSGASVGTTPNGSKRAKTEGALFGVDWKRIILDEGHRIRNAKTKVAQAVCHLRAQRRWVVTGTPIVNSANDFGSLLRFLRVCTPLDQHDFYNRLLARPLAKCDPKAAEWLQLLVSTTCLRRTKDMEDQQGNKLVPLPTVHRQIISVVLEPHERQMYNEVFVESRRRLAEFLRVQNDLSVPAPQVPMMANVLSILTRLRQLALHPALLPPNYLEDLRRQRDMGHAGPAHYVSPDERVELQRLLFKAIQDGEECSICFDILNDPRILPCTHYYCYECIDEVIQRQKMCPMDRRDITKADLIEPPPPPSEDDEASDDEDWEAKDPNDDVVLTPPSSKVKQLISLLKLLPATEKSLVFSQYTSFLDLIELQLQRERIPYVRLDGSLSEQRRTQVIQEFSVPLAGVNGAEFEDDTYANTRRGSNAKGKQKATVPNRRNPVVMLISLKAGALGLNLTVASRVFLMDPWWQSAIEEQAIDRVNRIGQTKEVHVYRLVAADTVETRVLAIQARKQRMINEAFSGTSREANRQRKKSEMLHNVVEVFQPSQ